MNDGGTVTWKNKVEALEDKPHESDRYRRCRGHRCPHQEDLKDFANKYNFPGFRQGAKAPRPIIDNALGARACARRSTTTWSAAPSFLAIDDCDLYPSPSLNSTRRTSSRLEALHLLVHRHGEARDRISSYEPVEIRLPAEGTTDAGSGRADRTPCASTTTRSRTLPPRHGVKEKQLYRPGHAEATDDKGEEIPVAHDREPSLRAWARTCFPAEFDEQPGGPEGRARPLRSRWTCPLIRPPSCCPRLLAASPRRSTSSSEVSRQRRSFPRSTTSGPKEQMGFESVEGPACAHHRESVTSQKADMMPRLKGERLPVPRSPSAWRATSRGHAGDARRPA